jgi:hypothetical protein
MIDFIAGERHFGDHLYPIWGALPARLRGTFYVPEQLLGLASAAGVAALPLAGAGSGGLTVVASYGDLQLARDRGRRVVYCEHGAGQSYVGVGTGSYIGAVDRAGVVATLVPGRDAARRHEAVHPTIRAYPIGCPKLDRHHASPRSLPDGAVVAVSFHWSCRVCRETQGAHSHYRSALGRLAERFETIGHGHPRAIGYLRRDYAKAGIEVVEDFEEVIERATVYCVDNSSTMYEWASLDRPVVVLNAPWFRRGVEHGLRFWSHADVGPMVWDPSRLPAAVETALADPPKLAERRREIVRDVYIACDGKAARRAAAALAQIGKEWG